MSKPNVTPFGDAQSAEMHLSIKIGEHALDVSGSKADVWKAFTVWKRLSGFTEPLDPAYEGLNELLRQRQMDYVRQQQMIDRQQQYMSPQVWYNTGSYLPEKK